VKNAFSIPPPLSLAENKGMVGLHQYWNDGDRLGDRAVWGYRGYRDRRSYSKYTSRLALA
jgi:hypothetical protein